MVMEFSYTAITKDGRKETSTIEAANLATAGHMLKEQGLLPTQIQEQGKKTSLSFLKTFSFISLSEKINFVQNLGVMLKAGISISRCLQIMVKQTRNKKFKDILSDVYNQVQQGKSLAEALGKYPSVFPNIVTSMIKIGELSGNLDRSLEYLSIQLEREADLKSKVRGAMMYPSVIMGAMVIIGVLLSIFVLPNLMSIFTEQGVTLPLSTRIVINISNFMSHHAILAIGSMIGVIAASVAFFRTPAGKRAFSIFSVNFLIVKEITKKINLARFARILSSMLKSGVPIVQGLEVVAESLDNVLYRELLTQAADDVKLGKPLAESLSKSQKLFPVLVQQMVAVGEESGSTQEILEQLAIHYETEVDDTLKNLASIIEPLLILFIGGIVGMLALALITPIYSIYQNAS
jgi:type IV pilus assembly protein PilC